MYRQIQVINKFKTGRERSLQSFFGRNIIKNIKICDIYMFIDMPSQKNYNLACELLSNPISQQTFTTENVDKVLKKFGNFSWILEIGYLPGVTDNLGNTAAEIICESLGYNKNDFKIHSSQALFLLTKTKSVIHDIANECSNSLINEITLKSLKDFNKENNGLLRQPKTSLDSKSTPQLVNLNLDDINLEKIGKEGIKDQNCIRRGTLGLDIQSLQTIKNYFRGKKRTPRDIEIETLAQTWSEHCKHQIFSS